MSLMELISQRRKDHNNLSPFHNIEHINEIVHMRIEAWRSDVH